MELSFELLPAELAALRPAGEGRAEPNQFPKLPEPDRESFSLNPLTGLRMVFGDALSGKILGLVICAVCAFLLVLLIPLLTSDGT